MPPSSTFYYTATAATTWPPWNTAYNATDSTTATYVWDNWNNAYIGTRYFAGQLQTAVRQPKTALQIAAEQQEAVARQARAVKAEEDRLAAIAKADALLQSVLDETQRESLAKSGKFFVDSIRLDGSSTRYEIVKGEHMNVYALNKAGERKARYCIQPDIAVPNGDKLVMQKLLLESDEAAFLKTANATRLTA